MNFVPAKKNTLLIGSGTHSDPEKKHLFVIVTDKCADSLHLLFSICTIRPPAFHDPSCILAAGDHEFIKADSYVLYAKPAQLNHHSIIKCVAGWTYLVKEDVSEEVFKKVCDGILGSIHTPRWAKRYFAAQP